MTEKDLTLICANFEEFQAELHNAHSGIQTIQENFWQLKPCWFKITRIYIFTKAPQNVDGSRKNAVLAVLGISLGLNHYVVNDKKSIVNDYVAAEQQFCNKLNFIHDKYTRVLQYSSTLSKPANRVTNQEIVKKLGKRL